MPNVHGVFGFLTLTYDKYPEFLGGIPQQFTDPDHSHLAFKLYPLAKTHLNPFKRSYKPSVNQGLESYCRPYCACCDFRQLED